MSFRFKFVLLFLVLFAFRTLYGLCHHFYFDDYLQTYLLGLKWYCEGGWPYFGPDLIVTETGFYSQITGPLEPWLVGIPFKLLPIPEAPFLFINLLTTGILALWAWYLSKRLPNLSIFFIFLWIALLPWNLQVSTNPYNPSYLLVGSGLFFLGFFEALPSLSLNLIPSWLCFAFMGFGVFWDMQLHQSWVLLPPFVLAAFALRLKKYGFNLWKEMAGLLTGAAPVTAMLVPTYLKYGMGQSNGGFHLVSLFNPANFLAFFTILGRFLSLPCQETIRFLLDSNQTHHLDFFKAVPWLWPPGAFLILMSWLQPLSLVVLGWLLRYRDAKTRAVIGVTLFTFLLLWVSFWFTSKEPLAHIFYTLMPLLMAFSLTLWASLADQKVWRYLGITCLAAGLWFHTGWMVHMWGTQSLYADRAKVVKAIETKNYHLLGERRAGSHN